MVAAQPEANPEAYAPWFRLPTFPDRLDALEGAERKDFQQDRNNGDTASPEHRRRTQRLGFGRLQAPIVAADAALISSFCRPFSRIFVLVSNHILMRAW